jgi:3-phenylpropionate/trans-cinnamate dioxygenase ferredoxin subunit
VSDVKNVKLGPADLKEGELRGYEIGKRNVLVACVGGRIKAIDDWCNHAGCLLSGGHLEGNLAVCPCHEIGFDLDTGKNMTSPGIADDQPAFKTTVENGELLLVDFPVE